MATCSTGAAAAAPSGELTIMDAAAGAMGYAANSFSREVETGGSGRPGLTIAGAQAARQLRLPLRDTLPAGYLPLREARDMALLGRWTPLEDKMSPCLPARVLAAMQRRYDLGDQDAAAWLQLHARAFAGEPDAQRVFGRVCESGLYRAAADLQRAFFWYYRAGLQGDAQALKDAERLMRSTKICSAAMAEPMLVYAGQWRITAHLSDRLTSTSLFELSDDGTATGRLTGNAVTGSATSSDAVPASARLRSEPMMPSWMPSTSYRGGWAYDGIGHVLTIIFDVSESGARRWRSDTWQIELLGCRAGSLFGRDHRLVPYTLECPAS